MMYVVARVITSPTGKYRTARLRVTDAPPHTTLEQVLAALEADGRAAEFSEAGVPFGNHEVKADGTRGWPYGITGIAEAPAVTWADLTREKPRREGRRVTLRLTDAEHARYSLAAMREGMSLQSWFVEAADALVHATFDDLSPGADADQAARAPRAAIKTEAAS
jgi:hypothetical protein